MKLHSVVIFGLLMMIISAACFADEFGDLVKMADTATNLSDRFDYWIKAAAVTQDSAKKLELYQRGIALAKKLDEKNRIVQFSTLIEQCPGTSDAMKAEARFQLLMAIKISWRGTSVPSSEFEKFLTMPGRTPAQERAILSRLASVYHGEDSWYKEIDVLKRVLNHPETTIIQKQDALLALSRLYLAMNRMDESVACLQTLLKPEMKLTPRRRADTLLLVGDTLLKGDGWYYMPDEAQYQKVKSYYLEAMSIKKQNHAYSQGIMKLVSAAKKMGKHKEVLEISRKYLRGDNKRIDKSVWTFVKNEEANSLMALERFSEAVVIYEQLYKYMFALADTCMSLGQAYYRTLDYTSAMGMYDEALVELGRADDARPGQCKHWKNRLSGLIREKPRIEDARTLHLKRLNAEAEAAGKGPVAKIGEKDKYHLFGVPEKKSKQPPKSMKDVLTEDEDDILSDGLKLD